jgi:LytS/YehU family sensor histidine kinase
MAVMVAISAVLLWLRPEHFVGLDIFQAFLPTVLGVLLTIALRLRAERRQAQETRLVAARMEIELLKKNLQPHFLMNTLTALSQTVEEEPARAVRLIDDLSQEFRTLSRMASEKTVTLAEELELCRAHLRVMRARTDVDWELAVDGVEGGVRVPPALFLTLIENGFSHQVARPADRTFTLRMTAQGGRVRFEFLSPGEVTAETTRVAGGTGLRYVRARLEESFPGQWTLTQAAVNGGWLTVIEIPGDNSKGVPA